MKFLANMEDLQCMREFQNIIITLSKLTKECVIDMCPDKLHFIANEETTTTAPLVWTEIDAKLYFVNYIMEALAPEYNHIMLSVSPQHFGRALNALKLQARTCKLKLINLQFPCLRVEVDIVTPNAEHTIRQIVHDVPVTVVPHNEWIYYQLPQIPDVRLLVQLKSSRLLKNLIDKLKNISPTITFEANGAGDMNLMAKTEMATITTRYKNLQIIQANHSNEQTQATTTTATSTSPSACTVDCKKAAIFLTALQVPTAELSCGIHDDQLIHLAVHVRSGVAIHSILPAICI